MDLSKSKASVLSSLSSKKMREKHGLFIVEGCKSVTDTLGFFDLDCVVATKDWIDGHPEIMVRYGNRLLTATSATIRKISSLSTPSDVMAVYRIPDKTNVSEIDADKLYIVLDGVQDPGNLGTIVRTADWFGVDTIFASEDTVDVFNPKTVQSTMGSLCRVKVVYTDLLRLFDENQRMPVYGTLLEGEDIFSAELKKSGFIVMGNEGNGISSGVKTKISCPLYIPPYNPKSHGESLNVAIATAITLASFRGGK